MKVLKKVLTAIGHFFRNIWRYIMTNAWIQPILIVALIFAIIFGLTGIPKLFDKIESWFDSTTDNKIKNRKVIDYDDFMKLYNGNEEFFVVFGEDDCANCKTLYKTINTYMDDEGHKEIVNAKIYFFDVTDLLEDIEDDLDKYGDDFTEKSDNFDKLDDLSNILYDGYADVLGEFNNNNYVEEQTTYGKYAATWGIKTPTTVFFTPDNADDAKHSKVFNMVVGTWEYKQGYVDLARLFNSWHLSATDWDKAVTERDSLVLNYKGTI